ncbi:Myc-type basic helix-loop-helix (bHLH) domain [Trinorchestia longiramus]|nr:Myc-type basic helix-loop-helix (bHLH) domain [Trinorchestia longiramus]
MLPSGVEAIRDHIPVLRGSCDLYDEEDEFLDVEDHDNDAKHDDKKSSKPVMEKRRRARINNCLDELKSIIVDALNKDPSRHSKLEKADILEMTVKHLQQVQRQQLGSAVSRDPSVLHRFRGGFAECVQEVGRYVSRIDSVDNGVKQRLVKHLGQCVSGLQTMTPATFAAMAGVLPPSNPSSHMRPQFPQQQPLYEEPKGGHARALQNLILARTEAARTASLPLNLMPKNPNLRHVVVGPADKSKQPLPTSTPNISPQTLSLSLPVTPQSAKLSPSSSLSLSPEADSPSPTNQSSKFKMQNEKLYSVKLPIRPSHPSIQMKLEEPVLEFPRGHVPIYRKRSLDSLVEENRQCKKVKIEVLRDASTSCPGPIGQIVCNNNNNNNNNNNVNNVFNNRHANNNNNNDNNKNNNNINNILLEQQRHNNVRNAIQEEKDMWRPW